LREIAPNRAFQRAWPPFHPIYCPSKSLNLEILTDYVQSEVEKGLHSDECYS